MSETFASLFAKKEGKSDMRDAGFMQYKGQSPDAILPRGSRQTLKNKFEVPVLSAAFISEKDVENEALTCCQVLGCTNDLKSEKSYYQRYHVCEQHLKSLEIIVNGQPSRFCQQCGRFHDVRDFDEGKRSCRARLQQHNARRRKRSTSHATTAACSRSARPKRLTASPHVGASPTLKKKGQRRAKCLAKKNGSPGLQSKAKSKLQQRLLQADSSFTSLGSNRSSFSVQRLAYEGDSLGIVELDNVPKVEVNAGWEHNAFALGGEDAHAWKDGSDSSVPSFEQHHDADRSWAPMLDSDVKGRQQGSLLPHNLREELESAFSVAAAVPCLVDAPCVGYAPGPACGQGEEYTWIGDAAYVACDSDAASAYSLVVPGAPSALGLLDMVACDLGVVKPSTDGVPHCGKQPGNELYWSMVKASGGEPLPAAYATEAWEAAARGHGLVSMEDNKGLPVPVGRAPGGGLPPACPLSSTMSGADKLLDMGCPLAWPAAYAHEPGPVPPAGSGRWPPCPPPLSRHA